MILFISRRNRPTLHVLTHGVNIVIMSMDTEKTLRRGRKLIMRTEGREDKDVKTVWGSREKCRNGMRAEAKKIRSRQVTAVTIHMFSTFNYLATF